MGTNQPGEVAALRAIVEPDITVVTSIAEEHLEGLGDLAGVMREELAAADGVAVAVVPASQPDVVAEAKRRAGRVLSRPDWMRATSSRTSWGVDPDGRGRLTIGDATRARATARRSQSSKRDAGVRGRARAWAFPPRTWRAASSAMPSPPMRVNVEQHGTATLINDAYNSNPGSARAAIELLRHAGAGRQRVAVLATMLELGPQTPRLHDEVARDAIAEGVDIVAAIGEFAAALARIATDDPRVITADDVDGLWTKLSSRLAPDAVILLKGSRGMRLERLVEPITRWAAQRQTP